MSWDYEGIGFYVRTSASAGFAPLYRAWNGSDHFYTTNEAEYNGLPSQYAREGIAGYVSPSAIGGHSPLYRLYQPNIDDHMYTASQSEYDNAASPWQQEGIIGYVVSNSNPIPDEYHPMFRAYNAAIGDHFYTTSVVEMNANAGAEVHTFVKPYANFPDVVKLVGVINDQNGLRRNMVKHAMTQGGPLGNIAGKVDFVICFNANGGAPDHSGVDHNPPYDPRPLRGIIQVHRINLPNHARTDNGRMSGLFRLLAEEVGHYWIAFNAGQASIHEADGVFPTPTSTEMEQALNAGNDYPRYPMIGRQDAHWSPFHDGEGSPFESANFGESTNTGGRGFLQLQGIMNHVICEERPSVNIAVPGTSETVDIHAIYNHLERWLMGDYTPPRLASIGKLWPQFRVMEPRWAFPFDFRAGLFLELSDGRRFYLGYHTGPHVVRVTQVGSGAQGETITFPLNPFNPYDRAGFRIVQRDGTVTFQARIYRPASGCAWCGIVSPTEIIDCDDLMYDLQNNESLHGTDADHYHLWRTLFETDGSVSRLGPSVTTDVPLYVRLNAKSCLFSNGSIQSISLDNLQQDIPLVGPALLDSQRIIVPYRRDGNSNRYRENNAEQNAPKWLLMPPGNDFAFGGLFKLEACSIVSWAGGCRAGTHQIGKLRTQPISAFRIPPDPWLSRRQETPPGNSYKMLFCIAAREDSDISIEMLEALDKIRRAWSAYWPMVNTKQADTLIDF